MNNAASFIPLETLVETLIDWSGINSHSKNLKGLEKQLCAIKAFMAPLEATEHVHTLDDLEELSLDAKLHKSALGKALVLEKRPQAPTQILFSSHYDTVFPLSSPFQKAMISPCRRKLIGPGVADMKGGILVFANALHAWEQSAHCEDIGWRWVLTPDEEIGSPGSTHLLKQLANKANFGFVSESCLENGNLVGSRSGSINFYTHVQGKEAHAGRELEKGVNAIKHIAPFLEWLEKQKKSLRVNIGTIQGGKALNTVPEHCLVGVNVRSDSPEDLDLFLKRLQKRYSRSPYTLHIQSYRPCKPFCKKTKELFSLYQQLCSTLDIQIDHEASGGVCDGNTLLSAGLINLDTVGVHGGCTHTTSEYMLIDSLETKAKVLYQLLQKISQK